MTSILPQYQTNQPNRIHSAKATHHPLNHHLRTLNSQGHRSRIFRDYIAYQFDFCFEPAYFGTICWFPFVYRYEDAEKETRHFRNKLLAAILDCSANRIADPPDRPCILFFHEVKSVIINPSSSNPKWRQTFHTHFHLEDWNTVSDACHLNEIVQSRVRTRFDGLQRKDTPGNKAVVIRIWNRASHAAYNIKDYYSRRFSQDGDLVVDYLNSDLG